MNTHIIYEFPLQERIRVFIRLEQLFKQLDHFLTGSTIYDSRAAINTILDILTVFSRNDLKSEILKELDRHTKKLSQINHSENVDTQKLQSILDELAVISKKIYSSSGKLGINLINSDLFLSISQRSSIPGGTCSFDLPAFHYWLEQDKSNHNLDLERWTQPFNDIRQAITLILSFIRNSSIPTQQQAEAGFFQLALDKDQPLQLLRVSLDKSIHCFAEISGGKHRFTIRFMKPTADSNSPTQTTENIRFELTNCIF